MPHQIRLSSRAAFASTIAIASCVFATQSVAEPFCDNVRTIAAAAPQFASLRGEAEGMQFDGTLVLEGAAQCKIRNKSDLDNNWQPINEKWAYECLWEERTNDALPALTEMLKLCLPEASYSESSSLGAQFPNFTGGTFHLGDNAVVVDYNKDTHQLWLTVLPPGVTQ